MDKPFSLPDELDQFLGIQLVDTGAFFVGDLFARKFAQMPPDFGKHIVVFYRDAISTFHVASYLHLWTTGTIGLIGGGCTDGRTIRLMSHPEQLAINRAGGLLLQTLRYAFDRLDDGLEAFFGYCGNDRALQIDLQAGFLRTNDPNLLVRWNRCLSESERADLYQKALALGPF